MQLHEWQQCFLSDSVSGSLLLQRAIRPAGNMNAKQALAVYQNNCLGSRINALIEIYATCFTVLGEDYYRQLARQYASSHLANDHDLNDYDAGFAEFVEQQQRNELDEFSYLADLARLDKMIHDLHRVAEQECSDIQLLSDADRLVYGHSSLCKLVAYNYPVDKVWLKNQYLCAGPVIEDQVAPYYMVIQRDNYTVKIHRIDPQEYAVLKALNNIGLEELAKQLSDNELISLASYLPRWIQAGWLCWALV